MTDKELIIKLIHFNLSAMMLCDINSPSQYESMMKFKHSTMELVREALR